MRNEQGKNWFHERRDVYSIWIDRHDPKVVYATVIKHYNLELSSEAGATLLLCILLLLLLFGIVVVVAVLDVIPNMLLETKPPKKLAIVLLPLLLPLLSLSGLYRCMCVNNNKIKEMDWSQVLLPKLLIL